MPNEYDDIINGEKSDALNASMYAGLKQQPDTEAQLQKLSERTGVPLEAVRLKRPEVEIQDKLAAFDYEKVIKETPKLSAWLADPKNAALAHDDWENLSATERAFHTVADYPRALAGGLVGDAIGRTLSGASTLLDVGARAIDRPVRAAFGDKVADAFWYEPVKVGGVALDPLASLKSTGTTIKSFGDWMKPPTARQNLGTDVAGGIGQIGGQIATHLLTGGALTVGTMLAQGADVMADKTANDRPAPSTLSELVTGTKTYAESGTSSAERDTAILAGGAITALTEKYGLDKILNRVPPEIKNRTLRFIADKVVAGGIEAGQEFTEGLLHDLARKTLTNKDAELLDGVGREMSAAALSAAIVRSALGVKGHARAKEQEAFVKSLTDNAEASKLRERMPERYQQFLDQVTAGGPVENIFVPADKFATYFQDAGMDPAVEASKLGAQNFSEAQLAGTDVVIPTSQFVTQMAGTDHLQGLWNDLRFNQADMTLREAQEFEMNRGDQEIDMETLQRMTGVDTGDTTGFDAVKQQIMGELAGRFDPSTADAYATQYAAAISTMAQRAGMTPQELHQRFDMRVDFPLPDGLRSVLDRVDIDIDPMLDRIRAGDVPTEALAFGASLSEFIRDAGGLRDIGEVRDLAESMDRKPGQKKLVQPNGMALDMALEAAVEAGYFPGREAGDLYDSDLLDALAQDVGGNPIYSAHNENDRSANELRAIRAMQDWLDSLSVDLSTMSNAEVRALIERNAASEVGDVYDQAVPQTETEAFKNWFGDSKVVDADGKPLVMYHGTTNVDKILDGGFKDGWMHFTDSKPVADSYQEWVRGDEAGTLELYIKAENPAYFDGEGKKYTDIGNKIFRATYDAQRAGHDAMIITNIRDNYDSSVPTAPHTTVVTFRPNQIKSATGNSGAFDPVNPNILYQNTGDKRGSITIGADMRMRISLFEKANLSTFLHETGHFYLEVLGELSSEAGAPQQMVDDYAAVLKWMGVKEGEGIQVKHHEMFARANEAYLLEGNAPNPELRGVFQRFRAWLVQIYKSINALNVPMSDEIRGVFDRIYATDAQIEAARSEGTYTEAFATAADAGMTQVEFEAYQKAVAQTVEQGRERLQTKLMNELTRERTKQWKAERERMQTAVEAEVDAEPVYVAFEALKTGKLEDGTPIKLSRDDLVRLYGKEFLKSMPRGFQRVYQADGGVDVETAAEIFGFDNGRALVDQLVNMQPRDALVKSITDQRMKDMFGDIRFDGTIADEANNALHNDRREDMLKIELRAIRRKAAEVAPLVRARDAAAVQEQQAGEQFVADALPQTERTGRTKAGREYTFMAFDPAPMKRAAAGIIGQKAVRDVRPQTYLLAERNAAKEFTKAMKAKDYMTAAEQKQRELFNHYLYKEATAVTEEVQKKADWLKEQGGNKKRQALGKAGADYLEQVDEILERYEFKTVPLTKLDRRQSLAAWVNQQEAAGNAISVPEDVLNEARRVNWKQVPVDELRAVYDSVRNITHLARWKNKLLVKDKRRNFEDVKGELLAAIANSGLKSTGDLSVLNKHERTLKQKGAALWKSYDAAHMKVEQLVEWLDGGDIAGPWASNFFDLADAAQTKEYDLHRQVTLALSNLRKAMPKDWNASLWEKVDFDLPARTAGGGVVMTKPTRYTMLSVAMNMGNEQNMQRLRDGNQISDVQMQMIREAMTEQDWVFVQGVWDAVETLWPEMAALEKRATGLEPVKVIPQSFEVKGKTYRGGYFPLVYDSRNSAVGEKQIEGDQSVEAFLSSGVGRPTTNKGATKTRVENVNAPVLLDMNDVLGSHIAKVVKDISHREAVGGLHRILTDGDIKDALIDRLGEAYYRELRDWTKVLVNDRSDSMNAAKGAAKWAMTARTNLAIVTMGWKISTMMSQFAGFGPAADLVKPRHLAKAFMQASRSPRETWAFVAEKSGEMRHRVETLDRDVRDSMRRLADKRSITSDVQRTAFILTSYADRVVTVPTWLGGYNQAIAEGKAEEDAIRAGDRAVRLSQGGGGAKDLAAVQRNNELMKLMTMYYTPFSALYARLRDMGHQVSVQGIGYLPAAVARTIGLVLLPAVLGEMLAGRGPDDDEDDVWWAIRSMALYPVASLPGVRDFSGLLEQKIIQMSGEGKMEFAPSYQISPIVSAIGKAYNNLISKPIDVIAGERELDSDVAWGAFESAGLVVGLPTSQVRVTGSYLTDLLSGEAQPENAGEILRDLLFRRKKE